MAYAREAERLEVMSRIADNLGDVQWAKRWRRMAREMAMRGSVH